MDALGLAVAAGIVLVWLGLYGAVKLRLKRWLVIAAALALPVYSAVWVVRWAAAAGPHDRFAPGGAACNTAAALETSDRAAAIAALEAVRDDKLAAGGDRVCAAAEVARLRRTDVDSHLDGMVRAEAAELGRLLVGRRVTIADHDVPGALAVFFLLNAVVVLVAARELALWRSERQPGPVSVQPLNVVHADDNEGSFLADVIRERLAATGVPSSTGVTGELSAVLLEAVQVVRDSGEKNWLSTLGSMVAGAIRLPKGYAVAGTLRPEAEGKPSELELSVTVARTGESVLFDTITGADAGTVAKEAAFATYLAITGRDEIRRRTPGWLAWTSRDALRNYHAAIECHERGDYLGATRLLEEAGREEPANVLIPLFQGDCHVAIAQGSLDENILRSGPDDRPVRQRHYLLAVRAYLRAAARAPGNLKTRPAVAYGLSYTDQWIGRFMGGEEPAIRAGIVRLLGVLGDPRRPSTAGFVDRVVAAVPEPERRAAADNLTSETGAALSDAWRNPLREALLALAIAHYDEAIRGLSLANRLSLWRRLVTRRETAGEMALVSAHRLARRRMLRAGRLATKWVALDASASPEVVRALDDETKEVSRDRWYLKGEDGADAAYNIAACQACRAAKLRAVLITATSPAGLADPVDEAEREATRYLTRACAEGNRRLPVTTLEYLLVDPDLQGLTRKIGSSFGDFLAQFQTESDQEREVRGWGAQVKVVARGAVVMEAAWVRREIQYCDARTDADRPEAVDINEWFVHDAHTWGALKDWTRQPSVESLRLAFANLSAAPPTTPGDQSPGADEDHTFPTRDALVAWTDVQTWAEANAARAEDRADRVEQALRDAGHTTDARVTSCIGEALEAWRNVAERSTRTLVSPARAVLRQPTGAEDGS